MSKSNSTIRPQLFRKNGDGLFIIGNITEKEVINERLILTDDGSEEIVPESTIHFEYDEYPIDLADRDNLEEYITTNYDLLLEFAKKNYEASQIKKYTETEQLWDAVSFILNN